MSAMPLVVFSHLRWSFVWQRPQHLLSRFSRGWPVIFIEEPIRDAQRAGDWEISGEDVTVCRPITAVEHGGFHTKQIEQLQPMLRDLLDRLDVPSDFIAWFYTPMAVPLVGDLRPCAVVYDCMDALSEFKNAPPEMRERERQLMSVADVVFTGGPSLYRARQNAHRNVHCFPSSVDRRHFAQGATAADHAEQQALSRPRLGYFGVIDERIDLELIDRLAGDNPQWQIAMVGPIAKIDEAELPRRDNITYFGQRKYEELPLFVAGWDVCLLPFARNESTRFISPTKTLEYMAAGKPIIGTRIADVADLYSHIVYLGDDSASLTEAGLKALAETDADRARRHDAEEAVLAATSWDKTASEMEARIRDVLELKNVDASGKSRTLKGPFRKPARRGAELPTMARVVVAGAGPTGLSAAYHLGPSDLLLEKNDCVGGWCRSIESNGFTFDYAGHIMFSNDSYVHELYERLLGENVHWQDREAWIYSHCVHTRYPFQGALYGLPPEVITECILGAIEARFGAIESKPNGKHGACAIARPSSNGNGNVLAPANGNGNGHHPAAAEQAGNGHGANGNGDNKANPAAIAKAAINDCCADGVLESSAPLGQPNLKDGTKPQPRNFEEFIYQVWGAGIAKHFAIPYNRKLWAVPLTEMETSWLGGRVPMPDLRDMIQGALTPVAKPMGPNARFGYPLRGGFQSLMDAFLPYVGDRLWLGAGVARIWPREHRLQLENGEAIYYEALISTIPLPLLVRMIGDSVPAEVRDAVRGLRHVSVRCVHLGVGRPDLTEKHWIYYPEDTVFHRIFVQGNASPHCNPPGGFGLTCEITYSEHKPLPCEGDALIARCVADCRKVGLIGADDPILTAVQADLPYAYVVYDHGRAERVAKIRQWLETQDIFLAGRYSEWEYYNSDHAFLAGKKAVEQAERAISRRVQIEDSQAETLSRTL